MLDLGMLNSKIGAFPGLNLTQVINLLPLFFLSTIRVGAFMLSSPFYGMRGIPLQVRVVISFILGLAVVSFTGLPSENLLNDLNFIFIVMVEIAVG